MSPLEHQDRIDQLLAEIQSILLATVTAHTLNSFLQTVSD